MDPHWQSLKVPVTEDFSLDAGTWRGIGEKDAERIVEPPTVPLIDQLVAHVERSPDSVLRQSDNASGAALAALTVRFGSYFAILADASKPPWRTSQGSSLSLVACLRSRRRRAVSADTALLLEALTGWDAQIF